MPDFLDLVDRDPAPLGERRLGKARRHTDAQAAGDELQESPAPGGVERVQPWPEQTGHLGPAGALQGLDDPGQAPHFRHGGRNRRRGPDQRHGFGKITDKIIRPAKKLRVDPLDGQGPHLIWLGLGK